MPIKSYLGKTFGGSSRPSPPPPLGIRRVKLVSSFRHGLIITVSFVASQIKGSEMLTKEPYRMIEGSEN